MTPNDITAAHHTEIARPRRAERPTLDRSERRKRFGWNELVRLYGRRYPNLNPIELDTRIRFVLGGRNHLEFTATELGARVELLLLERYELKITTMESCDVTHEQQKAFYKKYRNERRKVAARKRRAELRSKRRKPPAVKSQRIKKISAVLRSVESWLAVADIAERVRRSKAFKEVLFKTSLQGVVRRVLQSMHDKLETRQSLRGHLNTTEYRWRRDAH